MRKRLGDKVFLFLVAISIMFWVVLVTGCTTLADEDAKIYINHNAAAFCSDIGLTNCLNHRGAR